MHVFHGPRGVEQGAALERYLGEQFDRAAADPGDDFYGLLVRATIGGRPLTREEMLGFANIMFAGGRVVHASEEFFRVFMPLTHIGRVCPSTPTCSACP